MTSVERKKLFNMSKNVSAFSCCSKITAQCNFMTELGEKCSYLASIMFFIGAALRLRD